jgi:hypothetical protein
LIFWTESSVVCIEIIDHGKWRTPPVDLTGQGIVMMRRQVDSVAIHFDNRGTRVLLRQEFQRSFSAPKNSSDQPYGTFTRHTGSDVPSPRITVSSATRSPPAEKTSHRSRVGL